MLHQPKVPYRETITSSADDHDPAQEADRWLRPVRRVPDPHGAATTGNGYEFVDKIFGGSISQGYRPAVDKGIQEAAARGVLAGYPMVDFKVTLLDGKEHSVDSSEMAFKIAGRKAFRECASRVPPDPARADHADRGLHPRRVHGRRHGRPQLAARPGPGHGHRGRHITAVKAQVPLAEMLTYSPTLRSITGGRGDFHMEFNHYDEVPKHLQEKIIAAASKEEDEDEE